jgi:protease I
MDQEVLVDGNLVSSRKPDDLPAFKREMIELFSWVREQARQLG